MLDEIAPWQFDELVAFREIEPDPDERLREIVRRGFKLVLATQRLTVEDEELDPWYEAPSVATDQNLVVGLCRSHYGTRG